MYIKVRVIAGAKKEILDKKDVDHYKISVREPAERNLANARIIEIVQGLFPCQSVRIISGHHSPSKLLAVGSD